MYTRILLFSFLLPLIGFAQQKQVSARPKFQSSLGASLLIGESGPGGNFQLVNGFRINKWFAGLGVALDNYRFQTVPVFLSARREGIFGRKIFAYADAGISIPAVRDDQRNPFQQTDDFNAGFYSETGIGLKIPAGKKTSVRISAGYTFRTLSEKLSTPSVSSFWPDPGDEAEFRYKFQMLTLRLAVSLGAQ
jgi:hypothetical protein